MQKSLSAIVFRIPLALAVLAGTLSAVRAQRIEISPYAGGILAPGQADFRFGFSDLKEEGIFGVRGGVFLTPHLEVEGNFGYINHFEFRGTDPESRGLLWEASALYHLKLENRIKPFVTAGVGGLTAVVDEDGPAPSGLPPVFKDGDTFFTFSYGGGVKVPRLWGPLGLRGDVRGRTLPNLLGKGVTWLELTGGITLSF